MWYITYRFWSQISVESWPPCSVAVWQWVNFKWSFSVFYVYHEDICASSCEIKHDKLYNRLSIAPSTHSFNRYLLRILYVLGSLLSILHDKSSENWSYNCYQLKGLCLLFLHLLLQIVSLLILELGRKKKNVILLYMRIYFFVFGIFCLKNKKIQNFVPSFRCTVNAN